MLVKDFVAVSYFDYVNIVLDGELVETYNKNQEGYLEYENYRIIAVFPIKNGGWLTGIEVEIEEA